MTVRRGRSLARTLILMVAVMLIMSGVVRILPELDPARTVFLVRNAHHHHLVTQVDTGGDKVVALTFDDGPDPRFTPDVLDILSRNRVRATFFVIGESVERFPGLVEQAVLEGHEIENHTWSHPELDRGEQVSFYAELERCDRIVTEVAGRKPIYFRPPKRLYNQEVIETAQLNDYHVVLWTVGLENRRDRTETDVVRRVVKKVRPGAIILAHDGCLDRRLTVQALPLLIRELKAKGYRLVTLKELMVYYRD